MNCSFNRNECFTTATVLLLLVVLTIASVNGFSSRTFGVDSIIFRQQQQQQQYQRPIWRNMVTDGNNNNNNEENVAESMDDVQEITNNVSDDTYNDDDQQQSEQVGNDTIETIDEITQIKDEIAKLETDVKNKRRTLAYYNDMADDFTKTGYARKVAEMENMRRARTMLVSSNKYSATAVTLSEFLPVYDALITLRDNYGEDEFGKQYGAVTGGMKGAFTQLGTSEYTINIGEKVDTSTNRVTIVDSLYSSIIPKNHAIQVLSNGMELNGNIIRPAECIISLGEEVFDDEDEEEIATTTTTTASAEDEQANAEPQQQEQQNETKPPSSDGSSN